MMGYLFQIIRFMGDVGLNTGPLPNSKGDNAPLEFWQTGLQLVFALLGSVALLVIVISGIRYMLASGDPGKVAQARNTILYALVGLIISLSAFSIVTFVVKATG